MSNPARDLLWPTDPHILLRVVMLYVGQGTSNIILAKDGDGYLTLLHDIHLDTNLGGVDVVRLVDDLLDGSELDVFANSHPHNDHLCGVERLHETVGMKGVWHSNHRPSKQHDDAYQELQRVLSRVREEGGEEVKLCGSRSMKTFGEAEYYVLAPAEYVVDDIGDETPEGRDRRIHEHCAVLKFGAKGTWVMLTGDADRDAWECHITDYHTERLPAQILTAAHHGSRTFFRYKEEDEPYLDALTSIGPEYVLISAPKRSESPHGHPHESAVKLYADQVGDDNVLHTGASRYSFICDLYHDGTYQISDDGGALADEYAFRDPEKESSPNSSSRIVMPVVISTRVDDRPMGSH